MYRLKTHLKYKGKKYKPGDQAPNRPKLIHGLIKRGRAYKVEQTYPKHTGGPWYELSNGEKVSGKANAEEKELKLATQTKELKVDYKTK